MPAIDKAAGRVVALIVLLVLTGASLRGYLPAAGPASHPPAPDRPATAIPTIVLLSVSLGSMAVAFINRVRRRRPAPAGIAGLSTGRTGGTDWPSRRVLLIGAAVVFGWLVIVWLLSRLAGPHGSGLWLRVPGAGSELPATGTPGPPSGTEPGTPASQPGSGRDLFGVLAATMVGMLVIVAVTRGRVRRNGLVSSPVDQHLPDRPEGSEALARAAELGLAEIGDPGRGPREAIIGCYATMERELARVPDVAPQDFDTATEVLARAVEHHALPAAHATQLVDLFVEARFSPHLMTETHRQRAIRMLRLVLAELSRP